MPIFVNNVEIPDKSVFQEMQYHSAPSQNDAMEAAAKALLIRELLRQEAVKKNILDKEASADEVDTEIVNLVKTEVTPPEASEDACRRYYEQNKEKFCTADTAEQLSFEAVEDRIIDYLQTRSVRMGIQSYILDLERQAKVVGFDLASFM